MNTDVVADLTPPVPRSAPAHRSTPGRRFAPAPRASRSRAGWVAACIAILAACLYLWISVGQWRRMESPSWDLAIFTQLAKSYAEFRAPIVNIKGYGFNLLGDHFHPVLVLLGPVYALWPSGLTIMAVQDVLLALTAGIFAWFGTRCLGTFRGVCLGMAFALSFGVLEAVRVQFHEVAFAAPLLALSLCCLARGRHRSAILWAAPVVFVKEDLGVTVAVIGLVIAWRAARRARPEGRCAGEWPWRRLGFDVDAAAGLALVAWGVLWSALAVTVILPAMNPDGEFAYADKVDAGAALADPLLAFARLLFPWTKAGTLGLLVLAGAVVVLRSPIAWVALPTVVWRFLSPNEGYWSTTWHYNLVLMPVVMAAVLDAALAGHEERPEKDGALPRPAASGHRGMLALRARRVWGTACRFGPVAAGVVAVLLVPASPTVNALRNASHSPGHHIQAKTHAIADVPVGASVASDLSVLTRLVPDHDVRWIGTPGDPAPDYVVMQTDGPTWGGNGPRDPAAYARDHYGETYAVVSSEDSVVVLRRVG